MYTKTDSRALADLRARAQHQLASGLVVVGSERLPAALVEVSAGPVDRGSGRKYERVGGIGEGERAPGGKNPRKRK